jgi:hypothetical protein
MEIIPASDLQDACSAEEREWLSAIVKHLQESGPTPVVLGTLANPAQGGVARPDGVKIKLGDLLRKHGVGWGLVFDDSRGAKQGMALGGDTLHLRGA